MRTIEQIHMVPKLDKKKPEEVQAVIETIRKFAFEKDIHIAETPEDLRKGALIIPIGGDGTMTYAAQLAARCKGSVTGVHLGNLGFLMDTGPEDVESLLANIWEGDVFEEDRILLSVGIGNRSVDTRLALNEFYVSHAESGNMIQYSLNLHGSDAGFHKADGLIISTATGSTAYSLSAGGAIMYPTSTDAQIIAVAPFSLTVRPLTVDTTEPIRIVVDTPKYGDLAVRADGQVIARIPAQEECGQEIITIRRHPQKVKFLHSKGWNFYDVLSRKHGWNYNGVGH